MLLRTIVALLEGPRTDSPRTPEAVRPGSVVCRPLRATYVFALYAHVLRLWGACRMRDVGHGRQHLGHLFSQWCQLWNSFARRSRNS